MAVAKKNVGLMNMSDNRYTYRIGLHDHIRCMQFINVKICETDIYVTHLKLSKSKYNWILLDLFIFLSTKVLKRY